MLWAAAHMAIVKPPPPPVTGYGGKCAANRLQFVYQGTHGGRGESAIVYIFGYNSSNPGVYTGAARIPITAPR